ncbi:hypothetical protein H5410_058026 [Solanum commersonii]|uniref:Uncharacterized protein n=1 Tax=Solanum commersonii TaxID=4109 RepID=A0A9J5WRW7_SOLCO|nr:hypothetical protein H5410_058026 [Solanum commersonii]
MTCGRENQMSALIIGLGICYGELMPHPKLLALDGLPHIVHAIYKEEALYYATFQMHSNFILLAKQFFVTNMTEFMDLYVLLCTSVNFLFTRVLLDTSL